MADQVRSLVRPLCALVSASFLGTVTPACARAKVADSVVSTAPVAAAASSTVPATARPTTLAAAPASSTTLAALLPTTASTTGTTVDPSAATVVALRTAVDAAITAFSDCLLALPKCETANLSATRGGVTLERNVARAIEWNTKGYAVRHREKFRYVVEGVVLGPEPKRATVTVCVADGSMLVKPGAGPGGADLIVDGAYVSGREAWDMRLDGDGVWRVYDGPAVGPTESTDVCPGK